MFTLSPGEMAERSRILDSQFNELMNVFADAIDQAAFGKGHERHQIGATAFVDQPICELARQHGVGFATGQSAKKSQEATRMEPERAVHELLGAMNYLAAAVIVLREQIAREQEALEAKADAEAEKQQQIQQEPNYGPYAFDTTNCPCPECTNRRKQENIQASMNQEEQAEEEGIPQEVLAIVEELKRMGQIPPTAQIFKLG